MGTLSQLVAKSVFLISLFRILNLIHSSLQVTAAELKVILDRYSSTDQLAMNGVTVGGTKYMFLSANDRVVRARKGQSGVHCIKTVQALIVCVYEEPVVPEQAATVTEKLGEYLISVGY